MPTFVAVDLGASSGRVVLADVAPGRLVAYEVHRFDNQPVSSAGPAGAGLHWDVVGLYRQVLRGLAAAAGAAAERGLPPPSSVGIDSWAVDYALLDPAGRMLGQPYHYRDARTAAGVRRVHARMPHERLYAVNGLQFLPFTTVYQLAAEPPGVLADAACLLLIPDLVGYWLTGRAGAERTNASTTGLLDVRSGEWSDELVTALGLPAGLLPELRSPGEQVGTLLPHVSREVGLPASTPVVAVGSHDTASAVVAVPADGERFAYVSCGTWSLVGVELDQPVLTAESLAANFTNEGGVDGTVRYLRNVMGLWLLNESLRTWGRGSRPRELAALLAAAARLPDGGPVIDVDDPAFLPPGDMPALVAQACHRTGQSPPDGEPGVVRCIVDSLAAAYARAIRKAAQLSGREVDVVHLVGGGSRNALLCRSTAAATGLPVVTGPAEATALGNVLVQARSHGVLGAGSDLAALRALVRRTQEITRYPGARGG